ncbi:MAG: hypothetical protein QXP65_02525 [Candidatus Hadarchaeales archaeon]
MKEVKMSWSHTVVLVAAIAIYLATLAVDPAMAKASAQAGLREIRKLAAPIIVAMFLGGLTKNLLTPERISRLLGTATIGSGLPPCPFVAYPIIKSFTQSGLRRPAFAAMLITSTVVEVPQVFAGIAILGIAIEGARISVAFVASLIVGYLFLAYARGRRSSHH